MSSRIASFSRALFPIFAALVLAFSLGSASHQAWAADSASFAAGRISVQAEDAIDDRDVIQGLTSGVAYVGDTLSVSLTAINDKIPGFKAVYENGKARVEWGVADYGFGNGEAITPTYSSGVFSISVAKEYEGRYLTLYYYDQSDGGSNCNGAQIEVKGLTVDQAAKIDSVKYSRGTAYKDIVVGVSGQGVYRKGSGAPIVVVEKRVVLYVGGKKIGERVVTSAVDTVTFYDVPVNGYTSTNMRVEVYTGPVGPTWQELTVPAEGLGSNTVYATKINGKQAALRWSGVNGANGYYVYQGKKKVKTLGSLARTCTIKRKGAGKAKFRVVPFVKSGGKVVATGGSNTAKPQKNVYTYTFNKNVRSYSYWTCPFRISKVQLTGKTYKITGYALNNRMWKMQKYKGFRIKLYVDGKCVLNKKVNRKINAKPYQAKKITLKLKGKAGADLRNGHVVQDISYTPKWVFSNGKEVK